MQALVGAGAAWLDEVSFTPDTRQVTLGEALDAPQLAWSTEGTGAWSAHHFTADQTAGDVATLEWPISADLAETETATLLTTITGPAHVRFASHATQAGTVNADVSANDVALLSFTLFQSTWLEHVVVIPPGEQVVRWRFTKPRAAAVRVWLDGVTVRETTDPVVGAALDSPELAWTVTDGNVVTTWDPALSHDGQDAIRWDSTRATGSGAKVQTAITGPAWVRGWAWNASNLQIAARTITTAAAAGTTADAVSADGWRQFSVFVPPGQATVSFTPIDAFAPLPRLDEVSITPVETMSVEAATDSVGVTWLTTEGWVGLSDAASAAAGPGVLWSDRSSRPLTTAFTGAGTLAFAVQKDVAAVLIDGRFTFDHSDNTGWKRAWIELPPGDHTAEWRSNVPALLDAVTWTPKASPGMADALDAPFHPWMADGDEPWQTSTTGSADGEDHLLSPTLAAGQAARLTTFVSGPTTVRFKLRGEGTLAALKITATGIANLPSPTLSADWTEWAVPIPSSTSRLIMDVIPRGAFPLPRGAVQLDQFTFDNQVTRLIEGPFEASYSWTTNPGVTATLKVDGETRAMLSGTGLASGTREQVVVTEASPGAHTLVWLWTGAVDDPLTDFAVRPFAEAGSLSAALDATDLDVTLRGVASYGGDDVVGLSTDGDALRMGAATSSLQVWYDGPDLLKWQQLHSEKLGTVGRTHSSSGSGSDVRDQRLGTPGMWTEVISPLMTGNIRSTVQWVPAFQPAFAGELWFDHFERVPATALPVGAFLGNPDLDWTLSPAGAFTPPSLGTPRWTHAGSSPASITTQVTGPGYLHAQTSGSWSTVVDGVASSIAASDGVQWRALPAGLHTVGATTSQDFAAVTKLRFLPLTDVAAALDLDETTGVVLEAVPPNSVGLVSPDAVLGDEDFYLSPRLTTTPVALAALVTGPSRLGFRTMAGGGLVSNVQLLIDGASATVVSSGDDRWLDVPEGVHRVQWVMAASTAGSPEARIIIDAVRNLPLGLVTPDLNAALDCSGLTFSTPADRPFAVVPDTAATGGSFVRCPWLSPNLSTHLDVAVTAPCLLGVSWRGERSGSQVTASHDSVTVPLGTTGLSGWRESVVHIDGSGPTTVRLTVAVKAEADRVAFDALVVVPDSAVPATIPVAVNAASLALAGEAPQWRGVPFGPDGACAVGFSAPQSADGALSVTLPAPGTLAFRHRLGSQGSLSSRLHVGDTTPFLSSSSDWETRVLHVPAAMAVSWLPPSDGKAVQMLDQVSFTPSPTVPLTEAFDAPGQSFTTGGTPGWIGLGEATVASDGADVLCSPLVPPGTTAWLETTITGPCTVSFGARELLFPAQLTLSVDGQVQQLPHWSFVDWQTTTFVMASPGPHVVRWTVSTSGGATTGGVLALDSLTVQPHATLQAIADALDAPALTFTVGPTATDVVATSTAAHPHRGSAAVWLTSFTSRLSLPVQGPADVSLAWHPLDSGRKSLPATLDGAPLALRSHENSLPGGWRRDVIHVEDGNHSLSLGGASVALDDLSVTTSTSPLSTLNTDPALQWTGDAASQWTVTPAGTVSHPTVADTSSLTLAVQGPGTLSYTVGGSGSAPSFRVNGASISFTEGVCLVPPGAHTLEWRVASSPSAPARMWLSDFAWTPGVSPLAAATGQPDHFWFLTSPDAFRVETVAPLPPATTHIRTTNEHGGGHMFALPPAAGVFLITSRAVGSAVWTTQERTAGAFSLVPCFSASSVTDYSAAAFTALPAATLGDAVEADGVVLAASPTDSWEPTYTPSSTLDGVDALRATNPAAPGSASLVATFHGPGTLRFSWKASSSIQITASLDGVSLGRSVPAEWQTLDVHVGTGPHEIKWAHSFMTAGSYALLDQIRWLPAQDGFHLDPDASGALGFVTGVGQWQQVSRDGRPVLRTQVSSLAASDQLTVLLPRECHFSARAQATAGVTLSLNESFPGVPAPATGGATLAHWHFAPSAGAGHIRANAVTLQPFAESPFWMELSNLRILPLTPVSLAEALGVPYPVTSVPAGAWEGVRAGAEGPSAARTFVKGSALLSFAAPERGYLRAEFAAPSGVFALSSSGSVLGTGSAPSTRSLVPPTPVPAGAASSLGFSANSTSSVWAAATRLQVVPTAYDTWATTHGLAGLGDGPTADTDNDGADNFSEYVAGTDPRNAAERSDVRTEPSTAVSDSMVLPLLRWVAVPRTDVTYTVETWQPTADGAAWLPTAATLSTEALSDGRFRYSALGSVPVSGTQLWRLRVTLHTAE